MADLLPFDKRKTPGRTKPKPKHQARTLERRAERHEQAITISRAVYDAVIERSQVWDEYEGVWCVCERCHRRAAEQMHHLYHGFGYRYTRTAADILYLCSTCHAEWGHGLRLAVVA